MASTLVACKVYTCRWGLHCWTAVPRIVCVAGRVKNKRRSGAKLMFYDLFADGARVQIMCQAQHHEDGDFEEEHAKTFSQSWNEPGCCIACVYIYILSFITHTAVRLATSLVPRKGRMGSRRPVLGLKSIESLLF